MTTVLSLKSHQFTCPQRHTPVIRILPLGVHSKRVPLYINPVLYFDIFVLYLLCDKVLFIIMIHPTNLRIHVHVYMWSYMYNEAIVILQCYQYQWCLVHEILAMNSEAFRYCTCTSTCTLNIMHMYICIYMYCTNPVHVAVYFL